MLKVKFHCLYVLFILFFIQGAYSVTSNDIFYSGDLSFRIQDRYSAGDTISTEIIVSNKESFPISEAYLVIDLVEGSDEPVYPSQYSDSENVIYEEKITGINLAQDTEIRVPYEYKIPENLKSGTYRLDIYLRTEKTPIVGIPHIHLPVRYESFTITGSSSATEPSVKILRTKTVIEGVAGPVGLPGAPSSLLEGEVYVEKTSGATESLDLYVTVCHWDDTTEENCILEKKYPFTISAKDTKKIDISMTSPEIPDAYAVRLEIKDKSGETKSIFRNRFIVQGPTVKIRKVYPDRAYYSSGESPVINVLVSGSPDHFTYPEVSDATLKLYVKDISSGELVYTETQSLPTLSKDSAFSENEYTFILSDTLSRFELCAETHASDGSLYDSYCVQYDSSSFFIEDRQYSVVDAHYDISMGIFSFKVCASDMYGMPLSANVKFSIIENQYLYEILGDTSSFTGCVPLSFEPSEGSAYRMILNDLDTKKQQVFELSPADYSDTGISTTDEDDSNEPGLGSLFGAYMPFIVVIIIMMIIFLAIRNKRRD